MGGKSGGGQHTHYEASDSLHSTSFARVLDLVSEGEIAGLANGIQSVYLDGTPIQNGDNSMNFKNVTVDFRTGTQNQDYIAGFPDVESETSVGVELKYGTPWVHSITNTELSAIRITLGVAQMYKADTGNGDIGGTNVDYQIELATDGGAYSVVLANSFNGKTMSAYQRSARIDLPTATTGWSIRVARLTVDSTVVSVVDKTTVVSYTEVIDAKLRYPMSAIVGVQVDAKQFTNIPVRAYDMYGRIVQVPSNYDPVAKTYTGVWDGTFKPSWTNNPAWIFRDLILNDRYGLGDRITAAQVDKWALYKIAQYCDVMVPDGKGGTEPRFTCNVYLQSQKAAYAVLQDLASIFRGISYWGGGTIMASADMPSDPVYVYTAANVIGGKFHRVGSSKKTRYTVALVSWNDPADLYKAKVEPVQDAEGIKRYGIQQVQITAFGCTSQGQAQRVGRWALATSRLETETISFDVGLDGAIALPGQIVRIADPSRMGRRNGGRIKTASGRVVTLDKAPVVNVGDNLTVILPSGISQTLPVFSVSGDSVTVNADWTTVPLAQSVWSVDSTDLTAPTYKILSIAEKDGLTYTITATQHEPGKFDLIENGVAIVPRPETVLDVTTQAAPVAVTVGAYTVSLQDVQKLALSISCDAVPGAVAYEGAFKRGDGNWIPIPRQPSPTLEVVDVLPDIYTAKMAAVNSIGITSLETLSAPTNITKNVNPKNAGILLNPSAPAFHVTAAGANSPNVITFTATLLALEGAISFSCTGGTLSNITATTCDLAYASMTGATATVTASITVNGDTYSAPLTINKVLDGAAGASTYTATIYKQASSQPAAPTGGTFNFATATLTPPTGWTASQPTSSTTPTWSAQYTFTTSTTGATVTAGTWATPVATAQNGATGAPGAQSHAVPLYQWAPSAPALPTGTSTLTWASVTNSGYTAADGWSVNVPSNPGTPGIRLYVAQVGVTAPAGTTSSSVSYASASVQAWSQNGTNGTTGVQSGAAIVYQWAATIPAGPSGSATWSWSTSAFGAAPTGWSLTPGSSPSPGYTLWAARVGVTDSAANTTTAFNWTSAAIMAVGYAGGNGNNGTDGASYVTAYCASATGSATSAPAATTGKTSLPATNSGGITGTWSSTVPTLTSGQYLYQSDGIYDPVANQVTWSIPYWSSLKVGSLSAITLGVMGAITSGSMDIGTGTTSWHVDATGNTWAGAGTFAAAPYRVSNTGAAVFSNVTIIAGSTTLADSSGLQWGAVTGTGKPESNATFNGAGQGAALNDDPAMMNPGTWTASSGVLFRSDDSSAGSAGRWYACVLDYATGVDNLVYQTRMMPISASNAYNLTCNLYTAAGNDRSMLVYIDYYNASGSLITSGSAHSTYAYAGVPPTGWSRQGSQIGAGTSSAVPSTARYCTIGVWFQYSGSGSSSVFQAAQDLRLERAVTTSQLDPAFAATLTDKVSKTAGGILSGPVSLTTGGSVISGTLTVDAAGNRTGGSGTAQTPKGWAAYNSSGVATIVVDAVTGAILLGGDCTISLGQSAYDAGTGMWLQGGSTPKFSMKAANGRFFRCDPANNILQYGGDVTGTQVVSTDALVNDSVSGVDVFSTADNAGSSQFVVSVDSKVVILAAIAYDSGSGTQGYSIEKFVSGTTWTSAGSASYTAAIPSSSKLFTLTAGTYRIRAISTMTNAVTNVTILKVKK